METVVWLTSLGVDCFAFTHANRERLMREVPGLRVTLCATEAEFLAVLPQAEVAIVWRFEQAWFGQALRLRWLVTPAAGRDYFKVVPPAGVGQFYGSFHGRIMGESVLAMMLAAARGVVLGALRQANDPWPRGELAVSSRLLRGAHVGILGFGHIGEHVARLAKPFGCRITGIKRKAVPAPSFFGAEDRIVLQDELERVLPTVDHLVVILPAEAGTNGLLDARRLALLPVSAWLYNVGRGNCIDEAALAAALAGERLRGACLDVYEKEPLPAASPLRAAPNVLLLPHATAFAPEYIGYFLDEFVPFCRERILCGGGRFGSVL
jgi:phosphoglycerate dehydrogenase-like enzyme